MALSVVNQSTAGFATASAEQIITPTTGNWLVAVVSLKSVDNSSPQISVGDWARNLWTLVYSGTVPASANNTSAQIVTQVWVAPAVQYPGWSNLGVYTFSLHSSATDVASGNINLFEVSGMANGFLTVDSVTVATASGATSLSITLPAPSGGANCLLVGCAGADNTSGTVSVSSAGWTSLTQASNSNPNATLTSAWRESTASQTVSWSSTVSANWAAVAVAIRVTGTAPPQPNPNWPAVEFQLGLGQNLSKPISAVQWTTLPNRLLEFTTQRGIQYELGYVQSSPTDLVMRNEDGAFSPRAGGSGSAVASGTATTLVVSNSSGATMTVGDFFQLQTSGGVLKEVNVFQITSIVAATNTTVTFVRADGTGGGAQTATATGDVYSPCVIDIYLPYRILASWGSVRYPVSVGWIERWPQQWDNPYWGTIQAVGIDVIATLTAAELSPVRGEILRRNPQSYWPMDDAAGSTTAQNASGVDTTVLTQTASSVGTANAGAQFGVSTQGATNTGQNLPGGYNGKVSIIGDAGNCWQQTGLVAADVNTGNGYGLLGAPGNDSTFPSVSSGVTICGVVFETQGDQTALASATADPTLLMVRSSVGTGAAATLLKLAINHVSSALYVTVWDKVTHASTNSAVGSVRIYNGFIFWAITFNQTSYSLYGNSNTSFDITGTCNLPATFGLIDIGGEVDSTTNRLCWNLAHAHIAIFPRRLTLAELEDLDNAVHTGTTSTYDGINDRISRKLAYAGWKGARVLNYTSFLVGTDILGTGPVAEKIANLADYEGGLLFADAAGQLQFRGSARAAAQVSRATVGDRPDLGEVPYVGDSANMTIDFDPTFIYNVAQVSNVGVVSGANPVANTTTFRVQNAASAGKYGTRTLGKTVSFKNNSDASNMANTYLTKYANPKKRLATVLIDAGRIGGNVAATWPFALGVEVGDVITVNRRPIGAPTISITCVVLQVQHAVAPNKWETTLTLAPR